MKKIDIYLSLITGIGVGVLFVWLLVNSQIYISRTLAFFLPIIFPALAIVGVGVSEILGRKFLFIYQLAKFLLVGAMFGLFDVTILNILILSLGITKQNTARYILFVGISFLIVTVLKYVLNKYWAFEEKEKERIEREFITFLGVTIISGFIQATTASFVFNWLVNNTVLSEILIANIGKLAGIIIASAWNFIGYKFFVFKK